MTQLTRLRKIVTLTIATKMNKRIEVSLETRRVGYKEEKQYRKKQRYKYRL